VDLIKERRLVPRELFDSLITLLLLCFVTDPSNCIDLSQLPSGRDVHQNWQSKNDPKRHNPTPIALRPGEKLELDLVDKTIGANRIAAQVGVTGEVEDLRM